MNFYSFVLVLTAIASIVWGVISFQNGDLWWTAWCGLIAGLELISAVAVSDV